MWAKMFRNLPARLQMVGHQKWDFMGHRCPPTCDDSTPSISFISTLTAIHPLLPPGGTGHQVPSLEWPVALQVFEAWRAAA